MTIMNDIRACLDNHLATMTSPPTIAWRNIHFTPALSQTYVIPDLVPTARRPAVRGLNPQQRYDGIYSILVCTPEGLGPGAGYDVVDQLLPRFEATTDIAYSNPTGTSLIVSLEYAEVGTSFLDAPYYCTPVNIGWYLYH
ncbi:Protein of unknown function DUF4128 [uncultured Caudovirales phage]|uniref:Tail completion protein n=1 Tax=uncultured Caudovirales phage TaxID=2100421 RepID=A0A6J5M368_9CAUD|nr:Protein of unknown function DUF4128 [uncultured Caudovirales phage]